MVVLLELALTVAILLDIVLKACNEGKVREGGPVSLGIPTRRVEPGRCGSLPADFAVYKPVLIL